MKLESATLGPGQILITLDGRLDIAGAAEIETTFSALVSHAQAALVDMAGVPFLASIGIRLILVNAKGLYRRGGRLVLFGADPQVEKVLLMTGVGELTTIVATREEALAAISATAGGAG
ncbi:STAS domain-containing protein [Xanthobacter dioxanivorans]|uniref:Anti-sigma factor antagonist n=1 Tax=Xanthobacter dioxanivorans TaxID=2528964 RepID=A0A974PKR9_9HYPH|nr:STAS domain-containing protein [Xanthobacter dioxanivorans]QRG05397.1 STAS domain-containing protein [Xanthobacter dioxanivorans]